MSNDDKSSERILRIRTNTTFGGDDTADVLNPKIGKIVYSFEVYEPHFSHPLPAMWSAPTAYTLW